MAAAHEARAPGRAGVEVGVLIAGGDSERAGVDKRFLVLEGRTLLLRNLAFLRAHFAEVAVVIGRAQELDLGDGDGVAVLEDAWPGSSPLVGIATALEHFRRPLFALAADIAFPDHDAALAVLDAFPGHDVSLPAMGRDHRQPLFAAYGPACLAPMLDLIRAGHHRIVRIFGSVSVAEVRFSDDSSFRNINTMNDYESARRESSADTATSFARPALVVVVGRSKSGRTTLIDKLAPELVRLGLRVGTVKHDARGWEIACRGRAGSSTSAAVPTLLAGELPLADIVRSSLGEADIVVAEADADTAPHRVELFRAGDGHTQPLCDPGEALALITDAALEHEHRFGLDDLAELARFLAVRLDSLRDY